MVKTKKSIQKIQPLDVAKGAAIVSAVSGVVAAGAALADEKTRSKVGKAAKEGMEKAKEFASDIGEQMPEIPVAIAHQVGKQSQKSSSKSKSSKKK